MEEKGNEAISHTPVLADRVLWWLRPTPGGIYVDCTVGQGGLAARILEESGPNGMLLGIDRDESAVQACKARLARYGSRAKFIHGNFSDLAMHLQQSNLHRVDGVVFDLGISSTQLGAGHRGFSFLEEGPLDMRMDQSQVETAADLVNGLPEHRLADLIYEFGEERYSRRIARAVVQARKITPLLTTQDLAAVIVRSVPPPYRRGRIHCATRTFQALRIAVNREIDALEPAFTAAAASLAPGGRLCIISFHSLEDRVAKRTIRGLAQGKAPILTQLVKKPEVPTEAECRQNPRARSAKLRVGERRLS